MNQVLIERQSQTPPLDVAIIGGGIGGLAAAVALRHAGIDAHVFERTHVLAEVGGGILIREPSVRLLEAWGLEAFHERAVLIDLLEMRDIQGTLVRTSKADFMGDGNAYSVHRADVHDLLARAVPQDRLHLGRAAVAVSNMADHQLASVQFADGSTVLARLVIGADGISSVVRKVMHDDEPHFERAVTMRGLCSATTLPSDMPNDRARMWVHENRMILALPVRGGTQVAVGAIQTEELPPEELWTAKVPTEYVLEQFADFDPIPLKLISSTISPIRANPIYDRDPISTWAKGRIVLLGDAAHPMAPRQGQGANQAVQDAAVLAEELDNLEDPDGALTRYQQRRVGPATALQLASRQTPDQYDPAHLRRK